MSNVERNLCLVCGNKNAASDTACQMCGATLSPVEEIEISDLPAPDPRKRSAQGQKRVLAAFHVTVLVCAAIVLFVLPVKKKTGGEREQYPATVVSQFKESCRTAIPNVAPEVAAKVCSCLIGRIQDKYTLEEYDRMNMGAEFGVEFPREVTRLAEKCWEQIDAESRFPGFPDR